MNLIEKITATENLQKAWHWLDQRRGDSHYNNDYWHFRCHKKELMPELIADLRAGNYFFSPCRAHHSIMHWCACDALVFKAMALVLSEVLSPKLSQQCYHLTGRGGVKACVSQLNEQVNDYRFVCRSDVNSYYATVNHKILLKQLSALIDDAQVMTLFARMLDRLDDVNAELLTVEVGITKGNPLSPLLGAVYLDVMDRQLGNYCKKRNLMYARFMDDWIILCKTRHQLRTVVRLMNRILEDVQMTKHPFKTFIGRIKDNGFDFLGYRIARKAMKGLAIAWRTWCNHREKLNQLYEQGASQEDIGGYIKRWLCWVRSGVEIDLERVVGGFDIRVDEAGFYKQFC